MKILLVEDEKNKSENIKIYLEREFETAQVDITKSYTTAMKSIYKKQYDLVLLDMSIPFTELGQENIDQNEFESFGGISVLDELIRINYQTFVIVITAFDVIGEDENRITLNQLHEQMRIDYPQIYVDSIHYNSSSIEWKNFLKAQIKILRNKNKEN